MPIYSYKCTSCNHEFDLKQGFDADPTQECPVCKSPARRLFHPVGVIYKGSGFYTTDYRKPEISKESKSPTSKSSSDSSEPSSSPSSSSESSSDSGTSTEKPAAEKPAEKSTTSASSTNSSD